MVVPTGRIFLRRLIDLSCSVTRLHHHIRITNETRLDLQWWLNFLLGWSGTSLILDSEWTISSAVHLFTDASGSKGWRAFWSNKWLQMEWSSEQAMHDIVWKELYAIVCTVNIWGHNWARKKILFHCDNSTVVSIWNKGSTRCGELMTLVRTLYFCAARYNMHIMITHIIGINNCIADAIFSFSDGSFQISSSTCQPPCRSHPCFADSILSQLRDRCQYLGIAPSTRRVYKSGIKAYYKFCEKFNKIQPLPASNLTLQFFCVHNSCYTSYKTLKVYLAAIRLRHLEQGLDDPTNDHLLHLVCRGIRRLQGDKIRKRLPITINLLRTLKSQLANSTFFTVLEQRLLWAAFSLAFYSFMRVSEFTTPPTSDTFSPSGLHWSDIQLNTNSMSFYLTSIKN